MLFQLDTLLVVLQQFVAKIHITPTEVLIMVTGLVGQYYVGRLNRLGLVLWVLSNVTAISYHLAVTELHGLFLMHTAFLAITLKDLLLWTRQGYPLTFSRATTLPKSEKPHPAVP